MNAETRPTARTFWSSISARVPSTVHALAAGGTVDPVPFGSAPPFLCLSRDPGETGPVDVVMGLRNFDSLELTARVSPRRPDAGRDDLVFRPAALGGSSVALVLRADAEDVAAVTGHLRAVASGVARHGVEVPLADGGTPGRDTLRVTRMAAIAGPPGVGEALVLWPPERGGSRDVAVIPVSDLDPRNPGMGRGDRPSLAAYGGHAWAGLAVGADDLRDVLTRTRALALVPRDLPGVAAEAGVARDRDARLAVAEAAIQGDRAVLSVARPGAGRDAPADALLKALEGHVLLAVEHSPGRAHDVGRGTLTLHVEASALRDVARDPLAHGLAPGDFERSMTASRDRGAARVADRLMAGSGVDGPRFHVSRHDLAPGGVGPYAQVLRIVAPFASLAVRDRLGRISGRVEGTEAVERLAAGFGNQRPIRSLTFDADRFAEVLRTMPAKDVARIDRALDWSDRNRSIALEHRAADRVPSPAHER